MTSTVVPRAATRRLSAGSSAEVEIERWEKRAVVRLRRQSGESVNSLSVPSGRPGDTPDQRTTDVRGDEVATASDVATYILERLGPMSAMKLEKLAYYSHAWHLVWEEEPLFSSPIEAWANGPVVRELYRKHRGLFTVQAGTFGGSSEALRASERSSIDAVLGFYGDKSAHWLSELTHRETPWVSARADLAEGERGNAVITNDALVEYYDGLTSAGR